MPLDTDAALVALRTRLLATVVATTGSTTLTKTATGFTRASGSFVTDGFRVGMEVTPAGFTVNDVEVITALTATTMTTKSHTAQSSGSGRSLAAGIPVGRALEEMEFEPTAGRPWIQEQFVPATNNQAAFGGDDVLAELTGLYVVTWYGLSGHGAALRRSVDAVVARFNKASIAVGSDTLKVRGSPGPNAGQIIPHPTRAGFSYCVVTVPWRAHTRFAAAV